MKKNKKRIIHDPELWLAFLDKYYQPLKDKDCDISVLKLRFIKLVQEYIKLNDLYNCKGLRFEHLERMATQVYRFATLEDPMYVPEFSKKVFLQIYAMIMSNDERTLNVKPINLANTLFNLMLDPIRYSEKLKQCSIKILSLFLASCSLRPVTDVFNSFKTSSDFLDSKIPCGFCVQKTLCVFSDQKPAIDYYIYMG